MIKSLRCVSCSFLYLFLALTLVWKCPPHCFPNFDLCNLLLHFWYHYDESECNKPLLFSVCLSGFYMFSDTFQSQVKNKITAESRMWCLNTFNCCWRPEWGKQFISYVAGKLTVPFPGDILRFWESTAAAYQLGFLQTQKPVRCGRGDGCIWGVWQRENHAGALNMNPIRCKKNFLTSILNQKKKKDATYEIY